MQVRGVVLTILMRKEEVLFKQHAATWGKQAANIPFRMFWGTLFFLSLHLHLTVFGSSFMSVTIH